MNRKACIIISYTRRYPEACFGVIHIERLFAALGCEIQEGSGSRLRVTLNDVRAVFHRPHPQKTIDKGALVSVRRFLSNAGVQL